MSNNQANGPTGLPEPKGGNLITCEEIEAQMRRDARAQRALTCDQVEAKITAAAYPIRYTGSGLLPGLGHQPIQTSLPATSIARASFAESGESSLNTLGGTQEGPAPKMHDDYDEIPHSLRSVLWGHEDDALSRSTGQGSTQN